jgi:5-methylthioadenosine/S-adenosylhomocysteine deaminase
MSLLLKNISYLVRSPEHVEQNVDVLVEGSRISACGKDLPAPQGAQVIEAGNCAVIPGLINAHTHLYQNFLKGISAGIELVPWCNEVLFPTVGVLREAFANHNRRPAYLWTAAAAIEMIRGGTTCSVNMDTVSHQIMPAMKDIGMRAVLAYTLANSWLPPELRGEELETRRKVLEFVSEWNEPGGLTQVFLAPSTLFLCDDNLLGWVREKAEELDLGVQIHVAEIASEVADSLQEWGLTPVQRLDRLGLLSQRLSAVHCVHLNQEDIHLLGGSGAQVVHCPKSNMKLADGIAPVVNMLQAGIPVALGNDGCASNDLLDMWEEMRTAVLLARVSRNDAGALNPADAFRMATVEAARLCRIQAGLIEPGYLADLAVVDLRGPHLRPLHSDHLLDSLVFCGKASDVRDTIINGQVVMKDRQFINFDEEEILAQADEAGEHLYARRTAFRYQDVS